MPADGENGTESPDTDSTDVGDGDNADGPSDADVVEAAATAAEDVVFSRYDAGAVDDVDVTATFDDGAFDVDVYVRAPEGRADEDRVVEDAALAARSAVDDLF